jgi:tRNA pseudouridine38-40 synthase
VHLGCHSQRRPESFSGRKFLIFQGNFRSLPGGTIFRLSVNTRAAHGSFQKVAFLVLISAVPGAPAAITFGKLSISHLRLPYALTARSSTLLSTFITMTENAQPAPALQTWKLTLAYDGTEFRGWQVQPGERTVQGELQAALGRVTGESPLPQGSGRTDAGVHALAQVASFALAAPIPPGNLHRALNRTLPASIRILDAKIAPDGFHARHSAVAKTYEYRLYQGAICPPFLARYVYAYPWGMDIEALQRSAPLFEGEHDFLSFAATDPDLTTRTACSLQAPGQKIKAPTTPAVRTIYLSEWEQRKTEAGELMVYRIRGNGFLHHMVRNLVGTMLEVGCGRLSAEAIPGILAARNRSAAGPTAPARGLFLCSVEYEEDNSDRNTK